MWEVTKTVAVPLERGKRFSLVRAEARFRQAAIEVVRRLKQKLTNAFSVGGHQLHGGKSWRMLRPKTIAKKGHATILVDKGGMRRKQSVRHTRLIRGRTMFVEVTATNNSPFSAFHQFGFRHVKSGGFVKKRPPVQITEQDMRDMRDSLSEV